MTLLPHQEIAICRLRQWKVGALFMEAGTGKTRVAVSLANSVDVSRVLYIAPLRTIDSIKEEVEKSGGFAAPAHYFGVESIGQSDRIYLEALELCDATTFCIVDESIKVKNYEAKRTKRVLEMGKRTGYRLVLNGTPLTRNLLDLWSQMQFLSPLILRMSLSKFKDTFCKYTTITRTYQGRSCSREIINGYANIDYLYSLVRNYIYECSLSLNIATNERVLRYHITDKERDTYNEIKCNYLNDEMMEFRNNNIFLEMTSAMQHSYCVATDKFRAVDDIFKEVEQSDTIIFCRFIRSGDECRKRYPLANVLSFQKEALGLNLQRYNNIIYFDKVWDYALMVQSGRRIYRTGQERDCHFYHLTGDVGLEEMIDKNVRKKVSMTEYFKSKTKEQLYECL